MFCRITQIRPILSVNHKETETHLGWVFVRGLSRGRGKTRLGPTSKSPAGPGLLSFLPTSRPGCGPSVGRGRARCTKPCLFGCTCPPAAALVTEQLLSFVEKLRATVSVLHSGCFCT